MLNIQAGTAIIMLPIQTITIPKFRVNSNLLSLLSLILLCVMVFALADSIAQFCQSEQEALNRAQVTHGVTGTALLWAEYLLAQAIKSKSPKAIIAATAGVALAAGAHYASGMALSAAYRDYYDCLLSLGGG